MDDLFSFMHNRGTPINRLPIMAKQVNSRNLSFVSLIGFVPRC